MKLASLPRTALTLLLFCGSLSAQGTPSIVNSSFPPGNVGVPYPAQSLQATGGTAPYTWSIGGQLPPGLSVNPVGVLSGTPTAPGTFPFTLIVVDSRQASASRAVSITIAGSGFDLTIDQSIQRHTPDQSRARLRRDCEGLLVGRQKLHASDLLGMHRSLEINDLVGS